MEFLAQTGLDWIVAIQSFGGWLEAPMRFFTFRGSQEIFFLVLPLIYWSVDAGPGFRVAIILALSNNLQLVLKLLFADPHPYWVSAQVKAFVAEGTFGIPSGPAQNTIVLAGIIASRLGRRWAWTASFALTFLVGFSRLYLGVHFVHDVLAGWLIGGLLLYLVIQFWDPAVAWLGGKSPGQQLDRSSASRLGPPGSLLVAATRPPVRSRGGPYVTLLV